MSAAPDQSPEPDIHTTAAALKLQGTPTFFLNGTKIEPTTYGDLADALDAALG